MIPLKAVEFNSSVEYADECSGVQTLADQARLFLRNPQRRQWTFDCCAWGANNAAADAWVWKGIGNRAGGQDLQGSWSAKTLLFQLRREAIAIMRLEFPISLTPDDNDTFLVTCSLLPEVTTFGATRDEAIAQAELAIEEAIAARIAGWQDIPIPDRAAGQSIAHDHVALTLQSTLKALLFKACKTQDVSRAELCRRLDWHREQVDRLFRLDHASRIDQIEAAFSALDQVVGITISPTASTPGRFRQQ